MLKVYAYAKCGTCRKALKWLDDRGLEYELLPIRETPPSKAELKRMLSYMGGHLRSLFNTSGQDYKTMNMKDRLSDMSESDAIDLLAQHGNLVKRPFAIAPGKGVVGFDDTAWERTFI